MTSEALMVLEMGGKIEMKPHICDVILWNDKRLIRVMVKRGDMYIV